MTSINSGMLSQGSDGIIGCHGNMSYILATARDRGLYGIITSTNLIPRETSPTAVVTEEIIYIGTIPLTLLIDEWNDINNSAYNQILLCIS